MILNNSILIFAVYKSTNSINSRMSTLMVTEWEDLHNRVAKLEKQNNQEILTMVEILANATFFGSIKKSSCEYAKNGQCSFFILENEEKIKLPTISPCRIKNCKEKEGHCHLEISNISCSLCQKTNSDINFLPSTLAPQTKYLKKKKTSK